jgi:hypothetical protein
MNQKTSFSKVQNSDWIIEQIEAFLEENQPKVLKCDLQRFISNLVRIFYF